MRTQRLLRVKKIEGTPKRLDGKIERSCRQFAKRLTMGGDACSGGATPVVWFKGLRVYGNMISRVMAKQSKARQGKVILNHKRRV